MTSVFAPTSLTTTDLLRLTGEFADDVRAGRRRGPDVWPRTERWAERLHSDDDVDVWLISWVPERSTELHDHAGSLGALTVVSGSLRELSWRGTRMCTRRIDEGGRAAFPLGWVHDVARHPAALDSATPDSATPDSATPDSATLDSATLGRAGDTASALPPTLSVHAYSPPLTAMSYYELKAGRLRRTRSELTTIPEA
ncbi:cupin domain-containing protein [Tsukamurella soli]|uniref:Cysteine dioxygenase family protein n=1 Tax=Tsukamurella soli TaxID=644556 RepID=A0ABP8J4C8_9ACTN